MMNQEKWRKSAQGVFNNIILIMLCSVLGSIFSLVGSAEDAVGFIQSFAGNGDVDMGLSTWDFLEIVCTILIVVGYLMYIDNLFAFSKVQENEADCAAVRRVRKGLIWSIVAVLTDYIAGWLALIFSVVAFFVMIGGYSRLKHSVTFPAKARRGASTLYASMIVELIGNILDVIPIIGDALCLIFSFIAFCMLLSGWAKIKNADVTDISTPVMSLYNGNTLVNVNVTPEIKAKVAGKTDEELLEIIQHRDEYSLPLVEAAKMERESRMAAVAQSIPVEQVKEEDKIVETPQPETLVQKPEEAVKSDSNTIPVADRIKDWVKQVNKKYLIGGVVAMVALIVGISMCGGGGEVNFEVQLPAWNKFVTVEDNVNLRQAPVTNSPRLMAEEGEMDAQFVWENEMNVYGMPRTPFRVGSNVACPVLSETAEWYEILVQMVYGYDDMYTQKVYVMKKFCKEVTPQPIANSYFYKIPKGKYKGKYLYYDMGGMFAMPSSLTLGWEIDGGYVFPKMFKHEFANNGGPETYDYSQITNEMLQDWFDLKTQNPVQRYDLYYNFAGIGLNRYSINLMEYQGKLK